MIYLDISLPRSRGAVHLHPLDSPAKSRIYTNIAREYLDRDLVLSISGLGRSDDTEVLANAIDLATKASYKSKLINNKRAGCIDIEREYTTHI